MAPCGHHLLLTKRSHVAFFPSVWIDKDFWFGSSSFLPPFSPLSPPSLPLSSFILCIFGIERSGEKERERAVAGKKNNGRRAQERGRDSFGVKGEVPVSSFPLLSWLARGMVTLSSRRPVGAGCVPFRWRSRKRRDWSKEKGSRGWGWCCWPRGRARAGRLWLRRSWSVQRQGSGPCWGRPGGWGRGKMGAPLPGPRWFPAWPCCPPQDWKEAAGHHWLLELRREKKKETGSSKISLFLKHFLWY